MAAVEMRAEPVYVNELLSTREYRSSRAEPDLPERNRMSRIKEHG